MKESGKREGGIFRGSERTAARGRQGRDRDTYIALLQAHAVVTRTEELL